MEGKVLGIPLAILVFVFLLGLIIGVPMLMFHSSEMKQLEFMQEQISELKVTPPVTPVVTVTPTATPSPTLKPVVTKKPVVTVAPTKE